MQLHFHADVLQLTGTYISDAVLLVSKSDHCFTSAFIRLVFFLKLCSGFEQSLTLQCSNYVEYGINYNRLLIISSGLLSKQNEMTVDCLNFSYSLTFHSDYFILRHFELYFPRRAEKMLLNYFYLLSGLGMSVAKYMYREL